MLPRNMSDERPGRQILVFLIFLNISQWMVTTFEMQKVSASPLEVELVGFMPWLMILRLTMPLVVFFRFHSSVVLVELWKEGYHLPSSRQSSVESNDPEQVRNDSQTEKQNRCIIGNPLHEYSL